MIYKTFQTKQKIELQRNPLKIEMISDVPEG